MDLIENYSKEHGISCEEALTHFTPINMESNMDLSIGSLEEKKHYHIQLMI